MKYQIKSEAYEQNLTKLYEFFCNHNLETKNVPITSKKKIFNDINDEAWKVRNTFKTNNSLE
jgi:hypothetical protein